MQAHGETGQLIMLPTDTHNMESVNCTYGTLLMNPEDIMHGNVIAMNNLISKTHV